MKELCRNELTTAFECENGTRVVIERTFNSNYYSVYVCKPGKKGKAIATRCTFAKAMDLAREYDN